MAMTPEGKVKAQIDKLLKAYKVWYFKPVSNGFGSMGIPDYICCMPNGHFLAIEAKADAKSKPTELQQARITQIKENNGTAMVIHAGNLDELHMYLLAYAGAKE